MDESSNLQREVSPGAGLFPAKPLAKQKIWFAAMRQKVEQDTQRTGRAQADTSARPTYEKGGFSEQEKRQRCPENPFTAQHENAN